MASAEKPMLEAYRRVKRHEEPLLMDVFRRLILEKYLAGTLSDA